MTPKNKFSKRIKEKLAENQEGRLSEELEKARGHKDDPEGREEYERRMKERLDALNAEILALEAGIQDAEAKVRQELGSRVEKLRQLAGDCYRRLDLARRETGESWEKYIEGTEVLWRSLEEAVEETKGSFPAS